MANKSWEIQIDNRSHKIEFKHNPITYRRKILVDGEPITLPKEQRKIRWDAGTKHMFNAGGHECIVATRSTGFDFTPELYLDGKNIDTGLSIEGDDPTRVKDGAIQARRIGVVAIASFFGLGCLWLNWRMSVSTESYYPELAMLGPALLVIAGYYASNPDDPWVLPKPVPARMIVMSILAIALGIANWWATGNGIYFLIFGSG